MSEIVKWSRVLHEGEETHYLGVQISFKAFLSDPNRNNLGQLYSVFFMHVSEFWIGILLDFSNQKFSLGNQININPTYSFNLIHNLHAIL